MADITKEQAIYTLEQMKTWSKDLSDDEIEAISYALHNLSERKQGKWIEETFQDYDGEYYSYWKCSECGRTVGENLANIEDIIKDFPYCHCGADMRGSENETTN